MALADPTLGTAQLSRSRSAPQGLEVGQRPSPPGSHPPAHHPAIQTSPGRVPPAPSSSSPTTLARSSAPAPFGQPGPGERRRAKLKAAPVDPPPLDRPAPEQCWRVGRGPGQTEPPAPAAQLEAVEQKVPGPQLVGGEASWELTSEESTFPVPGSLRERLRRGFRASMGERPELQGWRSCLLSSQTRAQSPIPF